MLVVPDLTEISQIMHWVLIVLTKFLNSVRNLNDDLNFPTLNNLATTQSGNVEEKAHTITLIPDGNVTYYWYYMVLVKGLYR